MRIFRQRFQRAFTLLEIMVAIALLTMIVAAVYSSWNAILKGTRVALDASAASQRTRITMRTLHDSLLCACVFNANLTNYFFEAEQDGDNSSLSFVARLPRSFPRSGKFGDLSMRRLEFTIEAGEDSKKQLVLRQRPVIMDFDKDEMQFPLVLAKNVTTFTVEFIDPKSGDWVPQWDNTNQLPREVRVTLGLGKLDQFAKAPEESMVDVVALPNQNVRQEWQISGGGQGINPNVFNGGNPANGGGTTGVNNGAPVK